MTTSGGIFDSPPNILAMAALKISRVLLFSVLSLAVRESQATFVLLAEPTVTTEMRRSSRPMVALATSPLSPASDRDLANCTKVSNVLNPLVS